jgi:PDZ domain-containing protein
MSMMIVALIASNFITLPYYAIAPGSARRVDDLVHVSDPSKTFKHQGQVLFTTVALYRVKPFDAVESWFNRDIDLVSEKQILGTAKPSQLNQINLQEMTDSKQVAVQVALRRIGVKEEGKGTQVASVGPKLPADGHLNPGDVILAIDGKPTLLAQDAIALIRGYKPGDVSQFQVQATNGQVRTETITYGENPETHFAYVGITLGTKDDHFDLPYSVTIDSGQVGGPSAGLAFTLEVIDTLTAGDLTGGRKVAVTGTIESDGSVGEVGGVPQKTAAVRASGARYFLVPASEYKEAKAHAGSRLTVIPVKNLEQALTALNGLGGNVAALGPPPASLQR